MLFVTLMFVAVGGLLWSERTGSPVRVVWKAAASTVFIAAALAEGALASGFGRVMLAGLALSWLGDVLLVGRSDPSFRAGLVAFLVAHIAYTAAFIGRDVAGWWLAGALLVLAVPALAVGRWLWPGTPAALRAPVAVYIGVITLMVAAAAGTVAVRWDWRILLGAAGFYASDIAVGRERFVASSFVNRAWGLPVYYGAQLLLAFAAGG